MTLRTRLARLGSDVLLYGVLIAVSTFMMLPFVWMVSTSLKPADEIFGLPPKLISARSSLESYIFLIQHYDILRILLNTFFIAASSTALQLIFCSLGGYGFAKFKFPGQGALFGFLLGTMIIPFTVTMVPLYIIMRNLHWIDTYWALIIPW